MCFVTLKLDHKTYLIYRRNWVLSSFLVFDRFFALLKVKNGLNKVMMVFSMYLWLNIGFQRTKTKYPDFSPATVAGIWVCQTTHRPFFQIELGQTIYHPPPLSYKKRVHGTRPDIAGSHASPLVMGYVLGLTSFFVFF